MTLSLVPGDLAHPRVNTKQRERNHRTSATAAWHNPWRNQATDEAAADSIGARVRERAERVRAAIEERAQEHAQRLAAKRAKEEERARRAASQKPEDVRHAYLESRLRRIAKRYDLAVEIGKGTEWMTGLDGTGRSPVAWSAGLYSPDDVWDGDYDPTGTFRMVDDGGHIVVSCRVIGDPALQEVIGEALLGVLEEVLEQRRQSGAAKLPRTLTLVPSTLTSLPLG